MANQDDNKSAFAAAAYLASRQNKALENVRQQYANEKYHDFNTVKEDALARRQEFRAQREHESQVALEKAITQLSKEASKLEESGKIQEAKAKKTEISNMRRNGYSGDGFDMDEVTKNFANTLDEIIEDFGGATREEMKVSVKRMTALMDSIEVSNASEKDFLLEQYKQTQDAMQKEYNKRANIAARATEKMSELGEQYLDISSLYAGFVDHNPVMMALFRLGSDFIKRSRESKKAQREAIIRDKKNNLYAEKLNKENEIRLEIERSRDDEINAQRQETLKIERESAERIKKSSSKKKPVTEVVDGFDASDFFSGIKSDDPEPTFEREEYNPAFTFPKDEFSGTGDEPLTQDFMASLFGGVDEDGDPTGFEREFEDKITLDDSSPIQVKQAEETPEQKAQALFIRQDAEETQRANAEYRAAKVQRDAEMMAKLTDIEDAILVGNKLTEQNGKAMDKLDGGDGLLEALGLGKIASLFKGPILKALMLFGPAVTAIGALLSKLGLGGIADKLTGGFDNITGKNTTVPDAGGPDKKGKPSKGGKFSRIGSKVGGFIRSGGSMLARGGSAVARGAIGLLGSTAGGVALAGAAGYGAGTLINDHLLSEDTKRGIGDFIGPKIDTILSAFGNEDATKRLEYLEQMKSGNGKTLGLSSTPDDSVKPDTVLEKQSNGSNLIISTDKIESNKVVNVKGSRDIEVPVQKKTAEKLAMMEEKIDQLKSAESKSNAPTVISPPSKPTQQKVVKSAPDNAPVQRGRSARNDDSSIQRLTDRFVGMGMV